MDAGPWLSLATQIMEDCAIPAELPSENFQKNQTAFLDALSDNVEKRLSDTEVMDNLSILDMSQMDELTTFYGQCETEFLAEHYNFPPEDLFYPAGRVLRGSIRNGTRSANTA